jgi:predicted PhzF superfamily epimerase YddE/YHI9
VPSLPFYHIDVFTQVPYQGNPASVLVGSTAFADRQMQRIAREIGLPGNGFVWPAPGERHAFHIRFFTPQQEVSLSGHTSLACAHAILSTGTSGVLPATVTLRTRTALLTVQRQDTRLWLTLPLPSLRSYAGAVRDLATVLHLTGQDLRQDLPLQLSPEHDLLIPLGDGVEITQVVPDLQAMATLGRRRAPGVLSLHHPHARPDSAGAQSLLCAALWRAGGSRDGFCPWAISSVSVALWAGPAARQHRRPGWDARGGARAFQSRARRSRAGRGYPSAGTRWGRGGHGHVWHAGAASLSERTPTEDPAASPHKRVEPCQKRPLRSRFRRQLTPSVRLRLFEIASSQPQEACVWRDC